jgi:predicted nucleotidyltransferase
MSFGLTERELSLIRSVFERYDAVESVSIFGSRALGTEKPTSDIDLALQGPDARETLLLGQISADLEALPMPYRFDVCWTEALEHEGLREHIERHGRSLYRRMA